MKHEGVKFFCAACKKISEDDEVCSFCGQQLPPEYREKAYFVPGYHEMTSEEKQKVDEWIDQLEAEEEARKNPVSKSKANE